MFFKKKKENLDIKKARNLLKKSSLKVDKIVKEQDVLLKFILETRGNEG